MYPGYLESSGGKRTSEHSDFEFTRRAVLPLVCATFESRFDALAFPGPMRRDRPRWSAKTKKKEPPRPRYVAGTQTVVLVPM